MQRLIAARTVVPLFLFAVLACVPVVRSQNNPAFNCDKASSQVEHIICASADLAGKDRLLATLYAQALADAPAAAKPALRTAQRDWLNRRNACSKDSCVWQAYDKRLRELSLYTSKLDEPYVRTLCGMFTTGGDRSRLAFAPNNRLIGGDAESLDVNNDGKPDLLYACEGGTIRMPCTEYKDAQGNALDIQQMDFEWNTYSTFGEAHFRYDNRTFVYHTYDDSGERPAFVSYVTPQNREYNLCDFDNKIANQRRSGDAPVCLALERGEPVEEIALAPRPSEDYYAFERFDTRTKAFGQVDIDNDGKPEDVLELHLQSGAGRGCDWNYFELATPDGRTLLKNERSGLVHALQGMDEDSPARRNCGLLPTRLLRHAGKVYYESNFDNSDRHAHEVRILESGRVATVCRFDRKIVTTIRSIKR